MVRTFFLLVIGLLIGAAAMFFGYRALVPFPHEAQQRNAMFEEEPVWFFQNMAQTTPARVIARGGAPSDIGADEWDPARAAEIEALPFTHRGQTKTIGAWLEDHNVSGLVVLHDGRVVYETYRNGADHSTLFTSWSVAKSVTATLVGLALGDGLIEDVTDPLDRYVPELKGTAYEGVPIEAALQMSSGVAFTEVYTDRQADVTKWFGDALILRTARANPTAAAFPRAHEPGTVFNYNTAESQILGWLAQETTGQTLSDLLSDRIWSKLGMEHDALWNTDHVTPDAVEMGGCCINAALRDWARFGQLMLQDGVWDGERILPEGWVAQATKPNKEHLQAGRLGERPTGYQYQWWTFPDGRYVAKGVFGQNIYVDPANRVVIARASAWPVSWENELDLETYAAFSVIAGHFGELPPLMEDSIGAAPISLVPEF